MAKALTITSMEINSRVLMLKTKCTVPVFTPMTMEKNTQVNGKTIRGKVSSQSPISTEKSKKLNMLMTN